MLLPVPGIFQKKKYFIIKVKWVKKQRILNIPKVLLKHAKFYHKQIGDKKKICVVNFMQKLFALN